MKSVDRKWQFSVSVWALLSVFLLSIYAPIISILSNPHLFRQRNVVQTVARVSDMISVESIEQDPGFIEFTNALKNMTDPPYLIFFDSGNLDVFYNHICNLEPYNNSVSRLAAVSFDQNASLALTDRYPEIPTMTLDLEQMKNSIPEKYENRGYIIYQLILLVRTRICALLAHHGIDFWAMQQDTIWFQDVGLLGIEKKYPDAHMIFDTVGTNQLPEYAMRMKGWICGSTFFVRASRVTYQFFNQVDSFTRSHQSPDSSIMTYLCGHGGYKCQRLPKTLFSSSDYFRGSREVVPAMIQMDFASKDGSKMEIFDRLNFQLVHENGTCDREALTGLEEAARLALLERIEPNHVYSETTWQQWKYTLKEVFNVDPFNNKVFLTVHFTLI